MIARAAGPEDEWLLDIAGSAAFCSRRPVRTIRAHCEPAACDVLTRIYLYSTTDLTEKVLSVRRRNRAA